MEICFLIQPQYISSVLTLRIISQKKRKNRDGIDTKRHPRLKQIINSSHTVILAEWRWFFLLSLPLWVSLFMSDDEHRHSHHRWGVSDRQGQSAASEKTEEGTAFLGALRVYGPSVKQWHKGKENSFFFLRPYAPVPHRSSPEWDMRSRDTAGPSRAGVLPRLSITHTHARTHTYILLFTLCRVIMQQLSM